MPPLTENKMFTAVQLMGATLVFATFHVMVSVFVPLAIHVTGDDCDVTLKVSALL